MTAVDQHDEAAALAEGVGIIHNVWKRLRDKAGGDKTAWLTRRKQYFASITQADSEAAAEWLVLKDVLIAYGDLDTFITSQGNLPVPGGS